MEFIPYVITGLCSIAVALIEWRATKDRKKEKEYIKEKEQREKELAEEQAKQKARMHAVEKGVQSLLRDRIIQAYNHYVEKGYIPIYGMENVLNMYEAYHGLDGNGTITELVHDLKDLPHEPPE